MNLQKYNQRVLAVLGTLSVVALTLILFVSGIFFVVDLVGDISRNNAQDNALVMESSDDSEKKLRKQEITFNNPKLIDTVNTTYLIPVTQVNLKNPEEYHEAEMESFKFGISKGSGRRRTSYRYTGTHNNLIIYNQNENTKTLVFNQKINISSYQYFPIEDNLYLFIKASKTDTNKNNKLDASDLESFYTYNVFSNDLQEIAFINMGLVDYYLTNESDEIILRFAIDKNNDGEIDEYREPVILKILQLGNNNVQDLIDEAMVNQIQSLID